MSNERNASPIDESKWTAALVVPSFVVEEGGRVIFRESTSGEPEPGRIVSALPPTVGHPRGGEYEIALDDGTTVIAWVDELSKP